MPTESRSVVLEEHVDSEYEPTEQEILDYSEWLGMDVEKDKDLMWIARAGLKVPLPPPWKPCTTGEESEVFYFNFETGESVWDHPCDEFHRLLYKKERAKKLGLEFDEAELDTVAERLGLSTKSEGDALDESGSMGSDGDAKKKKKKDKKDKKPKKDEAKLEAPKTLAPLSARAAGPKLEAAEVAHGIEAASLPSSESKMSSRDPSQSILSEDAEQNEAPRQVNRDQEGPPKPAAGLPPPPSGEPPSVAEPRSSSASLQEERSRLEEQHEKSVAAIQAEHKAKLAKHRRELQDEFELEKDRTFSELQEKHEKQVREERARLQQELASKKKKTKEDLEKLLQSEEEMRGKLSEAQAEAERCRSEAASVTRKCSAYDERVARLEEDLKAARKEISARKEVKEAESLKAQLQAKNEDIDRMKAGAAANVDRVAKLEEEMQRLRTATADIEALSKELQAKKEQCGDLEKQLEAKSANQQLEVADQANVLQEKLTQSQQDLERSRAKVASLEASLMSEVEASNKLQTKLSESQSDLAKASGNAAQIEELRRELDERVRELEEVRRSIATERCASVEELQKLKTQLEEEQRSSAKATAGYEEAAHELTTLKAKVAEERDLCEANKEEAAASAQEMKRVQALLDKQRQSAEEERGRLQDELSKGKDVYQQAQAEIEDLKKQLTAAQESQVWADEIRTLKDQLEQAKADADSLRASLETRTLECSRLQEQAAKTPAADEIATNAKLKVEVSTLKAELDTWRAACNRLSEASESEVPRLQALLQEEKAATSRAKAEAVESLAQTKAQATAVAAELEVRSKECGRLRAELQAVRPGAALPQDEVRELVSLRAKVLELETEVATLHQANRSSASTDEHKLRSMIKDRDDAILRLRADLAHNSARHSQEIEELQTKVNDARQEERQRRSDDNAYVISDLKANLRARSSEVEQLHSEVRASKSELERVRAEARHVEARAAARESSNIEAAKAAVTDEWKQEVDRLQADLQSRATEASLAKEKAERLAREVRRVQQEEGRTAKGQEALREELEQAKQASKLAHEEVADVERRCEEARAAVRAERSSRGHAESQAREYQRELRVLKAQLQEQAAESETLRNEVRKQRYLLEDQDAELARQEARSLEKRQEEDHMAVTGLRTAVELSQLSPDLDLGAEHEPEDQTMQPESDAALEEARELDDESHIEALDEIGEEVREIPPVPGDWWENTSEKKCEEAASPGKSVEGDLCDNFSGQAAALLEARRKEPSHLWGPRLRQERASILELRRQWKHDAQRLRSSSASREQALLQEARAALDERTSTLNRAIAEHRVIQEALRGTPRQGTGAERFTAAWKAARGDTGGAPITPRSRSSALSVAGKQERRDAYPLSTYEDLNVLRRWQHILGREPPRRSPQLGGAARSTSPLASRRSRSSREVDHHLSWLQNFSRQAARPLTARNCYGGW
ncbi:unnamed protein product [Effrenium voratum]|uniref:WW domain-containing protein n=1 Tax=Effrenium voratum TaxID=2562239 RepID=A0AA36JA08_9DINO|nr:unnamed protein product [Effrenium voratum]